MIRDAARIACIWLLLMRVLCETLLTMWTPFPCVRRQLFNNGNGVPKRPPRNDHCGGNGCRCLWRKSKWDSLFSWCCAPPIFCRLPRRTILPPITTMSTQPNEGISSSWWCGHPPQQTTATQTIGESGL